MAQKMKISRSKKGVQSLAQAAVAGILCVGLTVPGDLVAEMPAAGSRPAAKTHAAPQMTTEQKTLQTLNRFTFGPRPGDVAAVDRMGPEAWFQQQLHPERISDAALDARLANFPAMRLSQQELVARFPTPGMLRQFTRGAVLMPDDAVERAVYTDAAWNYEKKVEAKQAQKAALETSGKSVGMVNNDGGVAPAGISQAASGPVALPAGGTVMGVVASPPAAGGAVSAGSPAKDEILTLPPGPRWQRLVAMTPDEMDSFQNSLKGQDQDRLVAGFTPQQAELTSAMKAPGRVIGDEALSVRLLRDVYSERQLQAVMADFWLNHFSVYLHKDQNEPYLLPAYEREAILPNALGKFEDLLVATAESPAMLVYLDNWESIGPDSKAAQRAQAGGNRPGNGPAGKQVAKTTPKGINENYARELMELHTLGVKGGYTQADVIEVARCFTGWTIDRPNQGGEFLFNPNRHQPGNKTVLGHVIKEGGMNEGLEVLHILATSPSTARFVSEKLAERFVSDMPPPALVDQMVATFLKSDGDMRAVLTTMFHSPEFWSPSLYRAKVKTPVEFVASALRATNADVTNPGPLVQSMGRLGMPIYGMQTPNGYSWRSDAWVSSNALLTRMNFALVLAGNRLQGTRIDWPALLGNGAVMNGGSPDAATERQMETVLLGEPAAEQTRQAAVTEANTPGVQQQAEQSFRATPVSSIKPAMENGEAAAAMLRVKAPRGPGPANVPESPFATMAGLLLGSPDFQRR